ncbi:MAG: hypothetical protein KGL36_12325, partial [Gammaproteobacteria bacterium]|nr:hypothetical protein [Gammaproteobacteria bacterium]
MQERLVGAIILVALVVLIVPELLSGSRPSTPRATGTTASVVPSAPAPMRTVTVDVGARPPAARDAATSGA